MSRMARLIRLLIHEMPPACRTRRRATLALLVGLAAAGTPALSDGLQRQDQLVWDYAEFVQAFSSTDWEAVSRFVAADTKVGFGGDAGMDGVMRVFGDDGDCHGAMTRALESGCRKVGSGEDMQCLSPPQQGPDVVYLGARASFRYRPDAGRWMMEYLICGGD